MSSQPFEIGDKVRLKAGKSKIIVREIKYYDGNGRLKSYYNRGRYGEQTKYTPKPGWYIRFRYYSSMSSLSFYNKSERLWREADDFILFDPQTQKEITMSKPLLYQTKETPVRYGTFLIKNSQGEFVLEMKGENGRCEGFAEADIEVVTPFTVELTLLNLPPAEKSRNCHVICKEKQVARNDVLLDLSTGNLWRVTLVNSKCLSPAESKSKWMKIPCEFISLGEQ